MKLLLILLALSSVNATNMAIRISNLQLEATIDPIRQIKVWLTPLIGTAIYYVGYIVQEQVYSDHAINQTQSIQRSNINQTSSIQSHEQFKSMIANNLAINNTIMNQSDVQFRKRTFIDAKNTRLVVNLLIELNETLTEITDAQFKRFDQFESDLDAKLDDMIDLQMSILRIMEKFSPSQWLSDNQGNVLFIAESFSYTGPGTCELGLCQLGPGGTAIIDGSIETLP